MATKDKKKSKKVKVIIRRKKAAASKGGGLPKSVKALLGYLGKSDTALSGSAAPQRATLAPQVTQQQQQQQQQQQPQFVFRARAAHGSVIGKSPLTAIQAAAPPAPPAQNIVIKTTATPQQRDDTKKDDSTQVTIGFKTTSPIANGHDVRIFFPTGFLIPTAAVTTCSATTLNYFMTASLVGSSCNALNPRGILGPNDNPIRVVTGTTTSYLDVRFQTGSADAGAQSIVLNGVTLSATAMPTSNAFYVVTTADTCSAGMIATGAISNPAPGAPGSTGASVLLSTTVAIVCSLLFWL